jgi:hypothetical protein
VRGRRIGLVEARVPEGNKERGGGVVGGGCLVEGRTTGAHAMCVLGDLERETTTMVATYRFGVEKVSWAARWAWAERGSGQIGPEMEERKHGLKGETAQGVRGGLLVFLFFSKLICTL